MDFESHDGRHILDVKLGAQGIRDLHGALVQMALILAEDPSIEQACIVLRFPRLTLDSARDAWSRAKRLLHPQIAERLAVVLLVRDELEPWYDPKAPAVEEIARSISRASHIPHMTAATPSLTSRKFFEIWKVLLEAWLRQREPLHIHQLTEIVGCSYPTAMQWLKLLERRGELTDGFRRGQIALRQFPRETFEQGSGLADTLRQTHWFIDTSGRTSDPAVLLRRFQRARPPGIAIGGVATARHLDPHFDLHGIPRLDVTYWAPDRAPYDLSFLKNVDPALTSTRSKDGAVLAVHRLSRAVDLFDRPGGDPLPLADPVEVLLDLYELRLVEQANDLVRRLRGERPT